ncbi:MAG: GNAT family N-acetyltransferase [Dehalococcoidia bacterium]|nr:GNAT family N-acetyltransferase [Dehalococcoidia bacterium]
MFKTAGLATLLVLGFDFVRRKFLTFEHCYLYKYTLNENIEEDFMPEACDFTFKVVAGNNEADELAAATGYDFRRRFPVSRKSLDKGAIAFCIFVDREIVHIGWVALSQEAKREIQKLPYKVGFSNGEACTGGMWTSPDYRRMGLARYGYLKRRRFLKERGVTIARNAISVNNVASRRLFAQIGADVYAEIYYLKILCWQFFRQVPVGNSCN